MPGPPVEKRRSPARENANPEPREPSSVDAPARDGQAREQQAHAPRGANGSRSEHGGVVQQAHALQRAAGNQAVVRMLDEHEPLPASDAVALAEAVPLRATSVGPRYDEDAHEQEASRFGELVARAPSAAPLRALSAAIAARPLAAPHRTGAAAGAPPVVKRAIESPGRPLDEATRRELPRELGVDLAQIRVHTDDAAARSADAIGAEAYTVGRDIVFGDGRFAPHTAAGRGLLAHEVAHAGQQAAGAMSGHVQAQSKPETDVATKKVIPYRIRVDHAMSAAEIGEAFARQYYGASKSEVEASIGPFAFNRGTTDKEVKQGFAIANVPAGMQAKYDALDPDEKKKIDAEVNRRFAARTGRDPAAALGGSPGDRTLAAQKEHMRDELIGQRDLINTLPEDIKAALFAGAPGDKVVSPEDYNQLLRIATKLTQLTPEQRKDYLARVNAETTSLNVMEASVDSYVAFQKQRETQAQQNEEAAKPLLGAEDVYTLYKKWKSLKSSHDLGVAVKGGAKDKGAAEEAMELITEQLASTEAALLAGLQKKGFNSIAEFETAIEHYRVAFRTQAVNLALDLIARYEHMLLEERKKFQAVGAGASMATGIAGTDASKLYAEAHSEERESVMAQLAMDPMEKGPNKARERAEVKRHQDAASAARAKAESAVISGSGNDPIVAGRGIDREKLAGLSAGAAQAYLLETVDARAEDARKTRQEFTEDPDRIFRLDDLINASFKLQDIEDTSVYGRIIRDYISDEHAKHLLSSIAIGVVALALALLVPGGGWIAAAALVASAGISTYQALEALQEYQEGTRDYNLGFIQEEPSLIWVGVAMVAAAVDIGAATGAIVKASAILKESAAGLKTLEKPMLAFAKGEEAAESLLAKIEAAEGLRAEVKAALTRELRASEAAKQAWKGTAGKLFGALPGAVHPELVTDGFRALYYSVKRGVNTITKLRKDAQLLEVMGDITRMTGAERSELEAAFEEVKQLVKSGQAKSMDDASLLGYVDRWSINRNTPGFKEKLLDEMKAWKPLTAEQKQALTNLENQKDLLSQLYKEKREFIAEREALVAKQSDPATKSAENAARIKEIEGELRTLDPNWQKSGIAGGEGHIAKQQKLLTDAEEAARKSQVTLYDRLRAAAPADAARDATLKNVKVDQIGVLKTPPTPLQAEHIVSVREISDMEGFTDLPWKDQKAVVDLKDNLVAMDGAANASKGDRTWTTWPQASRFYEQTTIDAMVKREADVRAAIQSAIRERLPKLPAGKP